MAASRSPEAARLAAATLARDCWRLEVSPRTSVKRFAEPQAMSPPIDRCLMGFAVHRRRLQPQAGNGH